MLIFQRQYKISNFGGSIPPTTNHNPRKKNITRDGGGHNTMDEKMQQLIIQELGLIAAIALIGTILLSILLPDNMAIIALIFGVVTTIVGALSAFLNTKKLTEKQEETLTEYYMNNKEKEERQDEVETVRDE
jgi:uncharacterized protein YacL